MPVTIKNRWTDAPIATVEDTDSVREAVMRLVKQGVDLSSADLYSVDFGDGARLDGARLDGARLVGASLVGARLDGARLDGARLDGARLDGARLVGASLDGARLGWQSHSVLAAILFLAAGQDVQKRMIAGLILISRDWCWENFLKLKHRQRAWALKELAKWVQPDDGAPDVIRKLHTKNTRPKKAPAKKARAKAAK